MVDGVQWAKKSKEESMVFVCVSNNRSDGVDQLLILGRRLFLGLNFDKGALLCLSTYMCVFRGFNKTTLYCCYLNKTMCLSPDNLFNVNHPGL